MHGEDLWNTLKCLDIYLALSECLVQEEQDSWRPAKSPPDLSFTSPQTENIRHEADFSTASLKVILMIFREVQCILSFSKKILKEVQKQHLERGVSQWRIEVAGTLQLTSLVTLSPASSYWISFNMCKDIYTRGVFKAVENVLPHGPYFLILSHVMSERCKLKQCKETLMKRKMKNVKNLLQQEIWKKIASIHSNSIIY